jgi:hypothetical protein
VYLLCLVEASNSQIAPGRQLPLPFRVPMSPKAKAIPQLSSFFPIQMS